MIQVPSGRFAFPFAVVAALAMTVGCSSQKPEQQSIQATPPDKQTESQGQEGSLTPNPTRRVPPPRDPLANAKSAIKLWEALPDSLDQNQIFSPISLTMVLGMLANGVQGPGQTEVTNLLETNPARLKDFNRLVKNTIDYYNGGKDVRLANAVFSNPEVTPGEAYVASIHDYFEGTAEPLKDLGIGGVKQINDWVNTHTKHRIPTIIDHRDPLAGAVLLNAATFDGVWANQFNPDDTKPRPFNGPNGTQKLPAMHLAEASFSYVESDGCRALALPYDGPGMCMVVVLPKAKLTAEVFRKLPKLLDGLRPRTVDLILPKFSFRGQIDLIRPLTHLGVKQVFQTNGADFSPINERIVKVTRAEQVCMIDVDEIGTRAAAATMMVAAAGDDAPPTQKVNFHVDRPFAFAIVDLQTNNVLFMGLVRQPNDSPKNSNDS